MLRTQPVVEQLHVHGAVRIAAVGAGMVLHHPVVNGLRQRRRLPRLVLAPILLSLPPHMVADGALSDPEGLGNLRLRLPLRFEYLKCHDLLPCQLGSHEPDPSWPAST